VTIAEDPPPPLPLFYRRFFAPLVANGRQPRPERALLYHR